MNDIYIYIYIKKRSTPNTDPCSTLYFKLSISEVKSSIATKFLTNNWMYLLFHNEKIYEAICHDLQYQIQLQVNKDSMNKKIIIYCRLNIFNIAYPA